MKKIFSVFLCFTTLMCNISVQANDKTNTIKNISSKNVIFSKKLNEMPIGLQETFLSKNIDVKEDTLLEVLAIEGTTDTAVCVTNYSCDTMQKDIYISYVEDENNNLVIDNSFAEVLAQGPDYNMDGDYPPESWDGRYVVHAVATAALYVDGFCDYYKPYRCQFSYENLANVTVNSINVQYIADGFLFSYPGFENLGLDEYEHVVNVFKNNPVAGVTYASVNYFYADKVLMTSSGSPFVGHFLTFITCVNGEEETYTLRL